MIQNLLTPFQKFTKIESFSGILLFIATITALVWANSPWSDSYYDLWQYNFGLSTPVLDLNKPLILWINDGLMAIFFFLIGLEIKRELSIGELNTVRKATLPLFAAIGGLIVPMAIFMIFNKNPETSAGWGIPMATDIAFALAILMLLGKRVPLSLKIFLTALAIVDDLGAVLVIALFYSESINWILIGSSAIPLAILFIMSNRGIYSKIVLFGLGALVWYLFLKAGIHPTIAGVLLAFTVPIRQRIFVKDSLEDLESIVQNIKNAKILDKPILSAEQIQKIDDLEDWTDKVQSPLQQLEHQLHSWVAYLIMPVFALSNAGVKLSGSMDIEKPLVVLLMACLVLGKCIGISFMTWLSVKLKLAVLPNDISKMQVLGVAFLAGVGFTMSIFIANLAFKGDAMIIDSAKVGVLLGSLISGIIGYIILRFSKKPIAH